MPSLDDYAPLSAEELRQRLLLAERVCVLTGWTARHESVRDAAATEAWMEWADLVGSGYTGPDAHPDLDDEGVQVLADRRETKRMETLSRFDFGDDDSSSR